MNYCKLSTLGSRCWKCQNYLVASSWSVPLYEQQWFPTAGPRSTICLRDNIGLKGMKIYEGQRTIDGLKVTVEGHKLDEHYEVERFTKCGFEWTYEGESPRQLALAILVDHLGDSQRALRLAEPFMRSVVANLDNDWTLSGAEVEAAVKIIEAN